MAEPVVEIVPSATLLEATEKKLAEQTLLAPSIRKGLAEKFTDQHLPVDPRRMRTPSALDREREIRERLRAQDEHDGRRAAESKPEPAKVQEELLNAERVIQKIQLQSIGVGFDNPLPPPAADQPLTEKQVAEVEYQKDLLQYREGKIEAERQQALAGAEPEERSAIETRADFKVVEAVADYQKAVARTGVSPITVEGQLEATEEAKAAEAAAAAEADGKKARAIDAFLANANVPSAPPG
jgi:hypothetical protein